MKNKNLQPVLFAETVFLADCISFLEPLLSNILFERADVTDADIDLWMEFKIASVTI